MVSTKGIFIECEDDLLEVSCSKILDKLLRQCLNNYFPELKEQNIKIGYVIKSNRCGGAKAGKWIVLFQPDKVPLTSLGLKWIVVHELSHFVNLYNPDEIFKSKVPKKVWKMWQKLENENILQCDKGGEK